jgi:hypothetical protein
VPLLARCGGVVCLLAWWVRRDCWVCVGLSGSARKIGYEKAESFRSHVTDNQDRVHDHRYPMASQQPPWIAK